MSFAVERHLGSVAELHSADFITARRAVHLMTPDRRCVALGSTQRDEVVDAHALELAGRDVVRRQSGGGLVVMNPDEIVWIDVVIPAGDPLWSDDVGRAFEWLGECWRSALVGAGVEPDTGAFSIHHGALAHRELGRLVCFAGAGSGEVMDGARKVVGMSQRRTRDWTRFQCLVHRTFDPSETVELLAESALTGAGPTGTDVDRGAFEAHLGDVVGVVDDADALDRVVATLIEHLTSLH